MITIRSRCARSTRFLAWPSRVWMKRKGAMSNVEKKGRIPSCVGQASLAGSYYVAECTLCGWVGSSEALTDDCQCTQEFGDRYCLGDTDEIGSDRLLEIVQAMASAMASRNRTTIASLSTPTKPRSTWMRRPSCWAKLSRVATHIASAPIRAVQRAFGLLQCSATSLSFSLSRISRMRTPAMTTGS